MNTSNELFRLIATMSKQEKRYFKLYSAFYNKEQGSSYARLFDLIDKEKPTNDAALSDIVCNEPFAHYLPFLKNQLTDLILSSLVAYHTENKSEFELRKLLSHADILFDRGLYSHCRKVLARAEKKAIRMEQHLVLMDILARQRDLLIKNISESLETEIQALYTRADEILHKVLSTNKYLELMDLTQVIVSRHANVPNQDYLGKLQEIVQSPFFQDSSQATTFTAKITFRNVLGIYALLTRNSEEALLHYREAIHIWKSHPAMIEERPDQYRGYLTNYLNCLALAPDDEAFLSVVQDIKTLPSTTPEVRINSLKDVWNIELLRYMNAGDMERSAMVIDEIQKNLYVSIESIQPHTFITLCYNCGIFYFLEGKCGKTLEYLSMILNENRIELKRDIQEFTRIFNLITHYELHNVDILDNLIRSAQRFLKQGNRASSLEKIIFRSIRKLIDSTDTLATHSIFQALHNELCSILHHPDPRKPLGLMELLFWTESKLSTRLIRELFIEKMNAGKHSTVQEIFPLQS